MKPLTVFRSIRRYKSLLHLCSDGRIRGYCCSTFTNIMAWMMGNDLAMGAIGLDTGIFMVRVAEGITPMGRFGAWDNSTASAGAEVG